MNLARVRTDKQAAENGRWFEFHGSRFLIAAANTPAYRRALERIANPNKRRVNTDDEDALDRVTVEILADVVLKDWEGVTDLNADGEEVPVPFSKAIARKVLEESMEFRQFVERTAFAAANFIQEREAADQADLKSGPGVVAEVGAEHRVPAGA